MSGNVRIKFPGNSLPNDQLSNEDDGDLGTAWPLKPSSEISDQYSYNGGYLGSSFEHETEKMISQRVLSKYTENVRGLIDNWYPDQQIIVSGNKSYLQCPLWIPGIPFIIYATGERDARCFACTICTHTASALGKFVDHIVGSEHLLNCTYLVCDKKLQEGLRSYQDDADEVFKTLEEYQKTTHPERLMKVVSRALFCEEVKELKTKLDLVRAIAACDNPFNWNSHSKDNLKNKKTAHAVLENLRSIFSRFSHFEKHPYLKILRGSPENHLVQVSDLEYRFIMENRSLFFVQKGLLKYGKKVVLAQCHALLISDLYHKVFPQVDDKDLATLLFYEYHMISNHQFPQIVKNVFDGCTHCSQEVESFPAGVNLISTYKDWVNRRGRIKAPRAQSEISFEGLKLWLLGDSRLSDFTSLVHESGNVKVSDMGNVRNELICSALESSDFDSWNVAIVFSLYNDMFIVDGGKGKPDPKFNEEVTVSQILKTMKYVHSKKPTSVVVWVLPIPPFERSYFGIPGYEKPKDSNDYFNQMQEMVNSMRKHFKKAPELILVRPLDQLMLGEHIWSLNATQRAQECTFLTTSESAFRLETFPRIIENLEWSLRKSKIVKKRLDTVRALLSGGKAAEECTTAQVPDSIPSKVPAAVTEKKQLANNLTPQAVNVDVREHVAPKVHTGKANEYQELVFLGNANCISLVKRLFKGDFSTVELSSTYQSVNVEELVKQIPVAEEQKVIVIILFDLSLSHKSKPYTHCLISFCPSPLKHLQFNDSKPIEGLINDDILVLASLAMDLEAALPKGSFVFVGPPVADLGCLSHDYKYVHDFCHRYFSSNDQIYVLEGDIDCWLKYAGIVAQSWEVYTKERMRYSAQYILKEPTKVWMSASSPTLYLCLDETMLKNSMPKMHVSWQEMFASLLNQIHLHKKHFTTIITVGRVDMTNSLQGSLGRNIIAHITADLSQLDEHLSLTLKERLKEYSNSLVIFQFDWLVLGKPCQILMECCKFFKCSEKSKVYGLKNCLGAEGHAVKSNDLFVGEVIREAVNFLKTLKANIGENSMVLVGPLCPVRCVCLEYIKSEVSPENIAFNRDIHKYVHPTSDEPHPLPILVNDAASWDACVAALHSDWEGLMKEILSDQVMTPIPDIPIFLLKKVYLHKSSVNDVPKQEEISTDCAKHLVTFVNMSEELRGDYEIHLKPIDYSVQPKRSAEELMASAEESTVVTASISRTSPPKKMKVDVEHEKPSSSYLPLGVIHNVPNKPSVLAAPEESTSVKVSRAGTAKDTIERPIPLEKEVKKIEEEYQLYDCFPELHPKYEEKREEFCKKLEDRLKALDGSRKEALEAKKEEMWDKYWKTLLEKYKDEVIKEKLSEKDEL